MMTSNDPLTPATDGAAPAGEPHLDPGRYRQIMGRLPTGVTVITTAIDGEYHGMTANAIASVSLEPLLLLVCVERTAHMHGLLLRSRRFAVNILGEHQADVSRLFALAGPPLEGELRGVPFTPGPNGSPLLDDRVAYFECAVTETYPGGDHTIFLARVLDGAVAGDAPPLLYHRGAYRRLNGDADDPAQS